MIAVDDIALARRWADFYRSRGLNPLPSRTDEKRPMIRFSHLWEEPAPSNLFEQFETSNIQVMTGRAWRLLVIDLDGPEAREWFYAQRRPIPNTWATHSGGNGLHLWFRLPENFARPMPKAILWKGEGSHSAVERLCDRSLIVAPPSIHPKTKERYRFASKRQSPVALPFPAMCPEWIWKMAPVEAPKPATDVATRRSTPAKVAPGQFRSDDVLSAIGDKVGLAQSWGLRVASRRPNHAGWCPCHAVGREDKNPSASVSIISGRYWEPGERTISLFELSVRLGVYLDWRDAVSDLGRRFGVKEVA